MLFAVRIQPSQGMGECQGLGAVFHDISELQRQHRPGQVLHPIECHGALLKVRLVLLGRPLLRPDQGCQGAQELPGEAAGCDGQAQRGAEAEAGRAS